MPLVDLGKKQSFLGGGSGAGAFSGALVTTVGAGNKIITGNVPSEVGFDQVVYDVGEWFDSATSAFNFVIPNGVTRVRMFMSLGARAISTGTFPAAGSYTAGFRKNGVTLNSYGAMGYQLEQDVFRFWNVVTPALDVVAGDEISVQVTGAALTGADSVELFASDLNSFGIQAVTVASIGGTGAGVTQWTALTDTPAGFSGARQKAIRVNAGETALEFGDVSFQDGATFAVSAATAALGIARVYACTSTNSPRILTISSATIALGSPAQPWIFSVKDQTGGANTNNISIATEGAELIDGAAGPILITANFGSVTLYSDGSNLFSIS